MSSLRGAPSLGGSSKKQFTYDVEWDEKDDDDYIPEVGEETSKAETTNNSHKKKNKEKSEKKSKKESEKKKKSSSGRDSRKSTKSPAPSPKTQVAEPEYEDDFDEEPLDSDDYIPPVSSSPRQSTSLPAPVASKRPPSTMSRSSSASSDRERAAQVLQQEQLKEELRVARLQQERDRREWSEKLATKEDEQRRMQSEFMKQLESVRQQQQEQAQQDHASQQRSTADVTAQVEKLVAERLKAAEEANKTVDTPGDDENFIKDDNEAGTTEQQRRRQRERERSVQLRRLHEEEAARSLFQRLAQDVREVFHELNLSVVAAEKERLMKDERYRKEREMKERREEADRNEKLHRELQERAEREEKFWAHVEEREDKMRAFIEDRLRKDEEEREGRLKRDLEDRATRVQNERDMREQIEQAEKDRRMKQDTDARQRDNALLEGQLAAIKTQYDRQLDEVKRQHDLAWQHSEEMHKTELVMIEKRNEASTEKLFQQHAQQLGVMESRAGNASKLEELIDDMHREMESTKKTNEKLMAERLGVLESKEKQLDEQRCIVDAVLEDVRAYRQDLEKERARVTGVYAKLDLAISTFTKNAEEDRRHLQESQMHYDTLRQQAEKDRKLMLSEIAMERKVLEQHQEALLAQKVETLNEIQSERVALGRERTEAAVARERQNRDETDLLKSLREREMEYSSKIEAVEADRVAIAATKAEHQQLLAQSEAERSAVRREREQFESEKQVLLDRFEEVRRQAEDAAFSRDRLRKNLMEDRAAAEFGIPSSPAGVASAHVDPSGISATVATRLQMDLARQRAILQKMSS